MKLFTEGYREVWEKFSGRRKLAGGANIKNKSCQSVEQGGK